MLWPLDRFDSALLHIAQLVLADKGGDSSSREKVERMAADSEYARKWGKSGPWWNPE